MSDIDPRAERERDDEERLSTADLAGANPPQPSELGSETRTFAGERPDQRDEQEPLFHSDEAAKFRERWTTIQAGFVDEPRRAVEQADGLVAETMKRLAEMFAQERGGLEQQWDRGGDVSTEDLRQALRRYRSFFTRLLSI